MNLIVLIVIGQVLCAHFFTCFSTHIEKRAILVAPFGGTFKLVCAISIPIALGSKQSLAFSVNIQFQYPLPSNITDLEHSWPPMVKQRRRRSFIELADKQQEIVYTLLESIMTKYGINGRECLLRNICEVAGHPPMQDGLFGQLVHLLFTPRNIDSVVNTIDHEYVDAYRAGIYGVDCSSLFNDCNIDFNIISTIIDQY